MKHIIIYPVLVMLLLLLGSCHISESTPDTAYYDSFEAYGDTTGWNGISTKMFINDSPSGYGKHSVFIGGGCMYPTASRKVVIPSEGYYVLTCWGKTKTGGGTIGITNNPGNLSDKRMIQVSNNEWTHYTSNELFCTTNSTVTIEIFAGGLVPSNLYIDEIKIKRLL